MHKLALILCFAAGAAVAHSGATGIVKERMDGMSVLGKSMKALVTMTKSNSYLSAEIKTISQNIQAHAGPRMLDRFPAGSLTKVSEATPAIWEDWERFSRIAQELDTAARALEAKAGTGSDLAPIIGEIGATCKACHKDFRIKKN